MGKSRGAARIDPELRRQLDRVAAGDAPIEAVVYLRPPAGQAAVAADEMEALARKLLDRAAAAAGERERQCNVFHNLGMFVVAGGRQLVEELLKQPEVASAVANRRE